MKKFLIWLLIIVLTCGIGAAAYFVIRDVTAPQSDASIETPVDPGGETPVEPGGEDPTEPGGEEPDEPGEEEPDEPDDTINYEEILNSGDLILPEGFHNFYYKTTDPVEDENLNGPGVYNVDIYQLGKASAVCWKGYFDGETLYKYDTASEVLKITGIQNDFFPFYTIEDYFTGESKNIIQALAPQGQIIINGQTYQYAAEVEDISNWVEPPAVAWAEYIGTYICSYLPGGYGEEELNEIFGVNVNAMAIVVGEETILVSYGEYNEETDTMTYAGYTDQVNELHLIKGFSEGSFLTEIFEEETTETFFLSDGVLTYGGEPLQKVTHGVEFEVTLPEA